jgi:putative endopeptidase
MDEATIEAKGLAPLRPHLDAIAAIRDKHDLARALGESLRADVDGLNMRRFHTPTFSDCGSPPALMTLSTMPPTCCKAAWKCPTANTTFPTVGACATSATKYQAHVSALLKLAGFTDPDSAPSTSSNWSTPSPKNILPWRISDDIHKANNTWKQADFAANAPGLDWSEYFRGAGLSPQPASSSGSPQPSPESPLSSPLQRWTHGKTGWPST